MPFVQAQPPGGSVIIALSALAPLIQRPRKRAIQGGPLRDLIFQAAKQLGLASHVSVQDTDSELLVTVKFPPHAVTRRIPNGPDGDKALSELTLLLLEMARHAGSLGHPPPNGRIVPRTGNFRRRRAR